TLRTHPGTGSEESQRTRGTVSSDWPSRSLPRLHTSDGQRPEARRCTRAADVQPLPYGEVGGVRTSTPAPALLPGCHLRPRGYQLVHRGGASGRGRGEETAFRNTIQLRLRPRL